MNSPCQLYEQLAPKLCDSHVHVGHFTQQIYFSPVDVVKQLNLLRIQRWVVSSTSTTCNSYHIAQKELSELLSLAEHKALLQLWVVPEMLECSKNLTHYFALPFQGLKIHPYRDKWDPFGKELYRVFEIALDRHLPILIHTGVDQSCEAGVFRNICEQFPDVTTILGHGRPIEQTLPIIHDLPNVWVDTAFMPIEDIQTIILSGEENKIVFGSDFPLDEFFYPQESVVVRYRNRILSLVNIFGEDLLVKWGNYHFYQLYGL